MALLAVRAPRQVSSLTRKEIPELCKNFSLTPRSPLSPALDQLQGAKGSIPPRHAWVLGHEAAQCDSALVHGDRAAALMSTAPRGGRR